MEILSLRKLTPLVSVLWCIICRVYGADLLGRQNGLSQAIAPPIHVKELRNTENWLESDSGGGQNYGDIARKDLSGGVRAIRKWFGGGGSNYGNGWGSGFNLGNGAGGSYTFGSGGADTIYGNGGGSGFNFGNGVGGSYTFGSGGADTNYGKGGGSAGGASRGYTFGNSGGASGGGWYGGGGSGGGGGGWYGGGSGGWYGGSGGGGGGGGGGGYGYSGGGVSSDEGGYSHGSVGGRNWYKSDDSAKGHIRRDSSKILGGNKSPTLAIDRGRLLPYNHATGVVVGFNPSYTDTWYEHIACDLAPLHPYLMCIPRP